MLPGLVVPFPNCFFLVCVFILPLMVIVFKLYLLKRNVVTFYPLTVVLIFYLCSLLGRDIALIMVQICRKESILLLLLTLIDLNPRPCLCYQLQSIERNMYVLL